MYKRQALVNFSEDCPQRILVEHLPQIIEKLEQVLSRKYQEVNAFSERKGRTSLSLQLVHHNRKLVLEQIVTTLAAIADTVAQEFSPYYDRFVSLAPTVLLDVRSFRFMPQLKYLFKNAVTPDYRMLRGKTMECISLIGLAVGKEKVRSRQCAEEENVFPFSSSTIVTRSCRN